MSIVLKWNFRTLFSDVPRLVLTLLSIASTYAMLTGAGLAMGSFISFTGSLNEGLPKYLALVLPPLAQFSFGATMYMLFAVSIAERRSQYRLMCSAGCTTRQLVTGFLTESLTLDLAGGLPGVGLGFLIARLQLGAVDIPLRSAAYFGTKESLWGLLPLFLLVPLTLLAASIQLWRPPRSQKRRKQTRKNRLPFQKHLFALLFGAGGRLERALGKNERRHRAAVLFSVVANLSVLFMLTAGVSMGSVMEMKDIDDNTVYLLCENANEDTVFALRNILQQFQQNEQCDSYSCSQTDDVFSAELIGNDTAFLSAALKNELEKAHYYVSLHKFSDGISTVEKREQEAILAGKTVVRITDGAAYVKSYNAFLEQTEQFFFRYFIIMIFLSIGLNIVNIVHMNRLSRRREYAILTSLGMSGRQRMGMLLYESFWFTVQAILCGAVSILVLARFIAPTVEKAFLTESVVLSPEFLAEGWDTPYQKIMTTISNIFVALKPYWQIILLTVTFLFFGYLVTELLVNRKMNRDELVPILKDDMHE